MRRIEAALIGTEHDESEGRKGEAPVQDAPPVVASSAPMLARSRPDLPYVGGDDPPARSEVRGESRVRARAARSDTLGSWLPGPPGDAQNDDARERPTVVPEKRKPSVQEDDGGDDPTLFLPRCRTCRSPRVRPVSGLWACDACGKLGGIEPAKRPPSAPPPPLPA